VAIIAAAAVHPPHHLHLTKWATTTTQAKESCWAEAGIRY